MNEELIKNSPYVKFLKGSIAAYQALEIKDPNTLYFLDDPLTDEEGNSKGTKTGKLYLGDTLIAGVTTVDGVEIIDALSELSDVSIVGLQDGNVLGFDAKSGKWKPMSLPEACECSVMTGASSTTDGTEGYVPAPKIGDEGKFLRGDGTWATIETSSTTQIFEIEIETGVNHETAIANEVGDTVLQNGDIAIVKELINGNKRQYTSYVYEDENWKAMDGNYNAENVFFDEDITITQTVGNVTATNGSGSIPAAGKNIRQVFEALWTKEDLTLSIDTPSVSFSLSNSGSASGEVGSALTLPTATLTISDTGSYEYGSKDSEGNSYTKEDGTGVVFTNLRAAYGSKASDAVEGTYVEKKDVSLTSGDVAYTATSTQITEPLFLDGPKSYTFSYSATYKNSENPRKPITNLGNFINSSGESTTEYSEGTLAINQSETNLTKTVTGSATWKATGYRKWFWGYMATADALEDPTQITSAQIRAL